jgi:hypothetical protein
MKSGRTGWVRHVVRMGRRKAYTGFCWGNLRERDHLGDPGIGWRIIIKWFFRTWDVGVWTGYSWLRTGTGFGLLLMR